MREPDRARRVYRWILARYPTVFRNSVDESMEQTFADNLRERHAEGERLAGFLAWTFAETGAGVMRERIRRLNANTIAAAIGGILVFLPFSIMELSTASGLPRSRFALSMHIAMMFLGVVAIRMSIGAARTASKIRQGQVAARSMTTMALQLAVITLAAWSWVSLVVDQMPCFLGATGC